MLSVIAFDGNQVGTPARQIYTLTTADEDTMRHFRHPCSADQFRRARYSRTAISCSRAVRLKVWAPVPSAFATK